MEEGAARRGAIARAGDRGERAGNRRRESDDRPRRHRLRAGLGHHGRGHQEIGGRRATSSRGEDVVAVLTGHVLKDPDYVSKYHRGTLVVESAAKDGAAPKPIHGAFQNAPERVAATKSAILASLKQRRLNITKEPGLAHRKLGKVRFRVATQSMSPARQSSFEVRVPASTANLGAGFDCLGLALEVYLSVRATVLAGPHSRTVARSRGVRGTCAAPEGSRTESDFPRDAAHGRARGLCSCRACASPCRTRFPWPADWAAAPRQRSRESRWDSRSPGARSTRTPRCGTPPRWKGIRTTWPPRCSADWW